MSFWSKFGKIASYAAPIAAAPFTGGLTTVAIGAGAGAARAAAEHKGVKGILGNAALGAGEGLAAEKFLPDFGGGTDASYIHDAVNEVNRKVDEVARRTGLQPSLVQQLVKMGLPLAALIPAMSNLKGSSSPFGGDTAGLMDEARKSLELQRHRVEQAQPVYDTLVNMAYGSSPMTSRGSAPAGYTPNEAPQGAYAYQGPRFGRNG